MSTSPLRVLVVDDSALYRKIVRSVLEEIPGVEVVDTAMNGRIGLDKIAALSPDMITLDLEMPEVDGLGVLEELQAKGSDVKAIMISAFTAEGARTTNKALQLGAFDFVLKPTGGNPEMSKQQLRTDLIPKIEACRLATRPHVRHRKASSAAVATAPATDSIERMKAAAGSICEKPAIVGIGISTGGPAALTKMLPQLPANFPCPIVVVQHMPPMFTKSLAGELNRICKLEVDEASDGVIALPGKIWIAPGGSQMRVEKLQGKALLRVTDDPPERNCKPSVDYLFRSIAENFGGHAACAVLTGMGDDGTLGCKLLKKRGAQIIVQDEHSCVVYGMPRAVVEAGLADHVVPLNKIASQLLDAVGLVVVGGPVKAISF